MKKLLSLLGLLFTFLGNAQYSDTIYCDFGGSPDYVEYVIHYNQQQCPDSCNGTYLIEVLSSNAATTWDITGPNGYTNITSEDSLLCPGDYTLAVQANGNIASQVFSIDSLQPFSHSITPHNVSATGLCDGWAELSLSGGIPPYDINWYDQAQNLIPWETDTILDSLCAGTYYYTVDYFQPGCCDTCTGFWGNGSGPNLIPFTISEPLLVSVDWTMDEMCPWMCDGMAQVSASGGSGNYTFDIGFMQNSTGMFDWLCPGTYTVVVTDDLGGTGTATFDIFPAIEPWVTSSVIPESCTGSCDGSISLSDMSGTIISWSIDGGANYVPQSTFNGLCPGVYDIMGMNYNGCEVYLQTLTVAPGNSPTINNIGYTPPSGPGMNDGCVTQIDVTGGNPPYTYSIDGMPGWLPFCQLGEGTHQICVTDANGCEVCENITVVACDLTISTGVLDETCAGYCDGSAEAFVTGASGSETYNWTDSQGNYIDNTSIVSGLCPGDYIVDVIDVDGCMITDFVTIQAATPIVLTVQTYADGCNYPCNTTAVATAVGGTGQFEYSLDNINWSASNTFTGLCPGVHIMYVRDENGCTQLYTFIGIDNDGVLEVTTDVLVDLSPLTNCIGEISAIPGGGVEPYTYSWYECGTMNLIDTDSIATGLCPGEYFVEITDVNGCVVDSECDTINITASLLNNDLINWDIYPNPARDFITVTTSLEGSFDLIVFDMTGKEIIHQELNQQKNKVLLNRDMNVGVYIIEMKQNEMSLRKRLIVK